MISKLCGLIDGDPLKPALSLGGEANSPKNFTNVYNLVILRQKLVMVKKMLGEWSAIFFVGL